MAPCGHQLAAQRDVGAADFGELLLPPVPSPAAAVAADGARKPRKVCQVGRHCFALPGLRALTPLRTRKVPGCREDVSNTGKAYHARYRLCELHLRSPAVVLEPGGPQSRFCQKCSRWHPVSAFNGARRTCSKVLASQRQRQRRGGSGSGSGSGSPPLAATVPDAGGGSGSEELQTSAALGGLPAGYPLGYAPPPPSDDELAAWQSSAAGDGREDDQQFITALLQRPANGGATPAPPPPPQAMTIVIKVPGAATPSALPPGLPAEVEAWLRGALLAQVGSVVPGCALLTVDVLCCGGAAWRDTEPARCARAGANAALSLARALAAGAAGALLRTTGASVWVGRDGARFVRGVPEPLPPAPPPPELPPLSTLAAACGAADEAEVRTRGACLTAGPLALRCAGHIVRLGAPPAAVAGAPLRLGVPASAVVAAVGDCAALVAYDTAGADAPAPPARALLLTQHAAVAAEVASLARDEALPPAVADALVRCAAAALQPRPRRLAALAAAHLALHRRWPALLARALLALADAESCGAYHDASHDTAGSAGTGDQQAWTDDAVGGGMTLLHRAAATGDARAVAAVLAAGGARLALGGPACAASALAGATPMHLAAAHGDGDAAAAMWHAAPSAAAAAWVASRDGEGATPSHVALACGTPALLRLDARMRAHPAAMAQAERAYCAWLAELNEPVVRIIAVTIISHCVIVLHLAARFALLATAMPVLPLRLQQLSAATPLLHPLGSQAGGPLHAEDLPWPQLQRLGTLLFACTLLTRLPSALFMLWAVATARGRRTWRAAHELIFTACGVIDTLQSIIVDVAVYRLTGRVLLWPFMLVGVNVVVMPVLTRLGPCRLRYNFAIWLAKVPHAVGLAWLHPPLWRQVAADAGVVSYLASIAFCMLTARATDRRMRAAYAAWLAAQRNRKDKEQ